MSRVVVLALVLTLGLSACGRKGELEPPGPRDPLAVRAANAAAAAVAGIAAGAR